MQPCCTRGDGRRRVLAFFWESWRRWGRCRAPRGGVAPACGRLRVIDKGDVSSRREGAEEEDEEESVDDEDEDQTRRAVGEECVEEPGGRRAPGGAGGLTTAKGLCTWLHSRTGDKND